MSAPRRPAVVLAQLGGPERREEIEPFLYELFKDPEVLKIPAPFRQVVAKIIARTRAPQSALTYEAIGWSPIRRWTARQGELLAAELERRGRPAAVHVAMTCSEPMLERVVESALASSPSHVTLVPLYPQYSHTTTRGTIHRFARAVRGRVPVATVSEWYAEPAFLEAHAARIRQAVAKLPDPAPERVHVLYSAHSLPRSVVEKDGDPYPKQIEETIRLVNERLGNSFPWSLGYQSKVGPVEWIGPATPDVLAGLARRGVTQVVVVPIAFVSDHVETLYEIAILFAEAAKRAGIPHFVPVEGLNDAPGLIGALADVVTRSQPS